MSDLAAGLLSELESELEAGGFVLTVKNGSLFVRPVSRLSATERSRVQAERAGLIEVVLARQAAARLWQGVDAEPPTAQADPEYDTLAAWFLARLAAGTLTQLWPLHFGAGWTLMDPARAYAWYRERIEMGQLKHETMVFLRRLKRHLEG